MGMRYEAEHRRIVYTYGTCDEGDRRMACLLGWSRDFVRVVRAGWSIVIQARKNQLSSKDDVYIRVPGYPEFRSRKEVLRRLGSSAGTLSDASCGATKGESEGVSEGVSETRLSEN